MCPSIREKNPIFIVVSREDNGWSLRQNVLFTAVFQKTASYFETMQSLLRSDII